jgi:hypothetical protein
MQTSVGHHFRCPACNYDLFSAPLDGKCPECGRPIPKRKGLEKTKNPRRVNSQHRSRLRRARRTLLWLLPLGTLALVVAVGSLWFAVPRWLRIASWTLTIGGGLQLIGSWTEFVYHKDRIVPEDEPPE